MEKHLLPGAFVDRLTRRVAFIALVGLLLVAIATMIDVLLRWLFSAPIEGYEEVSSLLFAIIIAACFPAGLLQGRNITIRFLGKALGERATLWLEAIGSIATFFFFAVAAWQVARFAVDETENLRFTQTLEMLTGPWWIVVSIILVACVPVQFAIMVVRTTSALSGHKSQLAESDESI